MSKFTIGGVGLLLILVGVVSFLAGRFTNQPDVIEITEAKDETSIKPSTPTFVLKTPQTTLPTVELQDPPNNEGHADYKEEEPR